MSTQAWESLTTGQREELVRHVLTGPCRAWDGYAPVWGKMQDYVAVDLGSEPDRTVYTTVYPNAGPRGATDPKDLVARPNADGVWEV